MAQRTYTGAQWLREMQKQVGEWSTENFGTEQPPTYPLVGAGEEIGELTTSVLKRAQGIDDSDKYTDRIGPDAERDAVGDVVIYLLDTMYRVEDAEITVADGLARGDPQGTRYEHIDDPIDIMRTLYHEYGLLNSKRLYHLDSETDGDLEMVELRVGTTVASLRRFCEIRGYDFKECVTTAWEEVSGREWSAEIA